MRILVVGTENAGKTCLVESLLDEEFKSHGATQGADVGMCKIFSTNWSRQRSDQVLENLEKNFLYNLKATADNGGVEIPACGDSEAVSRASTPELEEPTIVVTAPNDDESQPRDSSSLSLPLVDEEELPVVSEADLKGVDVFTPACDNAVNAVIWDVSGQTVYHGLLSPFLTEDNVTVIVFDASQDLDSVPQPRSDGFTENFINPRMTGREVICYWFDSIHSYCHKKGKKNALSRNLPTIFLVGTHVDLIGDSIAIYQKMEETIKLLVLAFDGKPYAKLLAGNCGDDGIEEALRKYCFFCKQQG